MNRSILNTGIIGAILAAAFLLQPAAAAQSLATVYGDRGWLGVSVQDVTKKLAEAKKLKATGGAYVSDVVDDSPADEAGIAEGDVIVKFNGRQIDDSDELIGAVRRADPGDRVEVVVDRRGDVKTLTATLDELGTPRAWTFTVPAPDVPAVPPMHPRHFGMSFHYGGDRLGMELQTLGKQLAEYFEVPGNRGVLVSSVEKKGAAADAGLKAGDVIVRVNRNSVRDVDDVLEEIRESDRDTLQFEVVRKGKALTLSVDIGRERDDTSEFHAPGRREYLDALEELKENATFRKEFSRELHQALRELKRSLEEGARELRGELRRALDES